MLAAAWRGEGLAVARRGARRVLLLDNQAAVVIIVVVIIIAGGPGADGAGGVAAGPAPGEHLLEVEGGQVAVEHL